MQRFVKRSLPNIEQTGKISVNCDTFGLLDLPRFEDGKRLTCPPGTRIEDLLMFLSEKLSFERFFLKRQSEFKPTEFVEMLIPYQLPNSDQIEYITLDNEATLAVLLKLIFPYTNTQ